MLWFLFSFKTRWYFCLTLLLFLFLVRIIWREEEKPEKNQAAMEAGREENRPGELVSSSSSSSHPEKERERSHSIHLNNGSRVDGWRGKMPEKNRLMMTCEVRGESICKKKMSPHKSFVLLPFLLPINRSVIDAIYSRVLFGTP